MKLPKSRFREMKELLAQCEHCPLECAGLTRVPHTVLFRERTEHTRFVGTVTDTSRQKSFNPRFWIELPDKTIIDYRARMWLGDHADVPHGIFNSGDYPNVAYTGSPAELEPLTPVLFAVLTA